QSMGQAGRVAVVAGEPLDVVLERVEAGRGEHARLPHRAAEDLARTARAGDEVAAAKQHGSGRRAQTLRQAARHRVEARAELLYRRVEMHGGIEDARAIETCRKAAPLGEPERLFEIGARDRL